MGNIFHLTRTSRNKKTGPIPVSTTSATTCPVTCPLKGSGCYPEYGPVALHWKAITHGGRGYDLERFCAELKALPKGQLWRYGQAGDLPGDGRAIDTQALRAIVQANAGRHGFAYTHYLPQDGDNAAVIAQANAEGFTINLSANDLSHADELASLGIAPVVVLLPEDQVKPTHTPGGRHVAVCPASVRDDTACATCGICAKQRESIIGFPVHGTGKKRAAQVFSRSRNMEK